ncbi:restriction endonuclease subunit S [Plectonema cf. radiosum LEGE 06105]|uniref:Restriction endonuclease subunit S n=1 Tax=Plectonema cf. radiosum LEGE 06105 TaxID=945769 RepID=A0A8J7JZM6_9CYAN|nr:restriction endonuclease subunit S [Plectonema radiosum]MBE9212671.1 restriction endonuclease subunit S [Plectonema cf. radiosum LEGE 06105]
MIYLLDTNACIVYLNRPMSGVRRRLQSLSPQDIAVCSVVKAELFYGAMRSNNPERTLALQSAFLNTFVSLPFDDEVLQQLKIPFPPLNEQKRIVRKIEALQRRSQRVKEAIDAIPQLLDQFRQSVLAAAFRGDLTADWRENNPDVEPASVLLEKIRGKIHKFKTKKIESNLPDPFKIPNNWKWVSLSSICNSITDGDHQAPPKANYGIPFLVISNITKGKLDFSNIRYVPEEYYRSIPEHRKPKKRDILYSVVGSYGIPVIVDTEEKFCFQRHIALFKLSDFINSKYILYALKSNFIFKQATEVATGTAQLTVPLSGLRKIKIPLISEDEQLEIVHRIESFFKTIETIQQQYQQTKANLDCCILTHFTQTE